MSLWTISVAFFPFKHLSAASSAFFFVSLLCTFIFFFLFVPYSTSCIVYISLSKIPGTESLRAWMSHTYLNVWLACPLLSISTRLVELFLFFVCALLLQRTEQKNIVAYDCATLLSLLSFTKRSVKNTISCTSIQSKWMALTSSRRYIYIPSFIHRTCARIYVRRERVFSSASFDRVAFCLYAVSFLIQRST